MRGPRPELLPLTSWAPTRNGRSACSQLTQGHNPIDSMTSGFRYGLLIGGLIAIAGAVAALWTANSHGEEPAATVESDAEPVAA